MLTAMGMYRTVGLVGLGRMGQTLARGFARAVGPGHVFVCGRSPASITRLRQALPEAAIVSMSELPEQTNLVVLCVLSKPIPQLVPTR